MIVSQCSDTIILSQNCVLIQITRNNGTQWLHDSFMLQKSDKIIAAK